eukprot:scaffold5108_cov172-Amphora_coffeaeformis.AAC.18
MVELLLFAWLCCELAKMTTGTKYETISLRHPLSCFVVCSFKKKGSSSPLVFTFSVRHRQHHSSRPLYYFRVDERNVTFWSHDLRNVTSK